MAPEAKPAKKKTSSSTKAPERSVGLSAEYVEDSGTESEELPSNSTKSKKSDTKKAELEASTKVSKAVVNAKKSSERGQKSHPPPSHQVAKSATKVKANGLAAQKGRDATDKQHSPHLSSSAESSGTESENTDTDSEDSKKHEVSEATKKTSDAPVANHSGKGAKEIELSSEGETDSDDTSSEDSEGSTGAAKSSSLNGKLVVPGNKFVAPEGFKKTRMEASSAISSLFSASNLKGKQIWHITAPASVPASELVKATIRSTPDHPDISYKNTQYKFVSGEPELASQVLVPDSEGRSFRNVQHPIARILNLQQKIESFQAHDTQAARPVDMNSIKPKPVQPKGLKMRYRPFGDVATSDEEDGELDGGKPEPPQFQQPPQAPIPVRKEKRKVDDDSLLESSWHKSPSKKRKKEKQLDGPNNSAVPSQSKDSVKSVPGLPVNGTKEIKSNAQSPGKKSKSDKKHRNNGETKEERAARKAAKAARKEAKKPGD